MITHTHAHTTQHNTTQHTNNNNNNNNNIIEWKKIITLKKSALLVVNFSLPLNRSCVTLRVLKKVKNVFTSL